MKYIVVIALLTSAPLLWMGCASKPHPKPDVRSIMPPGALVHPLTIPKVAASEAGAPTNTIELDSNIVGYIQQTNGSYHMVNITAPTVSFHRTMPDMQQDDYGISDLFQNGNEVMVSVFTQIYPLGTNKYWTWILWGTTDVGQRWWIQLDCKSTFSSSTVTLDGGPVGTMMFYKVTKL